MVLRLRRLGLLDELLALLDVLLQVGQASSEELLLLLRELAERIDLLDTVGLEVR